MQPKIKKLSKDISLLIAAGEVIDKPVSIIKELVENSIDANSKKIIINIKNGGKDYISITDDGIGINPDELELAFESHATSKLNSKDDIYKIIKKGQKKLLKIKLIYDGPIEAPIKKDQILAKLKIVYDQDLVGEYDLLALEDIKKVNIFSRLMKSLNYLIWGDV